MGGNQQPWVIRWQIDQRIVVASSKVKPGV